MVVVKGQVGFKNPFPRRGSAEDASLRRMKLKRSRPRGIKSREIPTLLEKAARDMSRSNAAFGISGSEGVE